jgi:hypothetical protein
VLFTQPYASCHVLFTQPYASCHVLFTQPYASCLRLVQHLGMTRPPSAATIRVVTHSCSTLHSSHCRVKRQTFKPLHTCARELLTIRSCLRGFSFAGLHRLRDCGPVAHASSEAGACAMYMETDTTELRPECLCSVRGTMFHHMVPESQSLRGRMRSRLLSLICASHVNVIILQSRALIHSCTYASLAFSERHCAIGEGKYIPREEIDLHVFVWHSVSLHAGTWRDTRGELQWKVTRVNNIC